LIFNFKDLIENLKNKLVENSDVLLDMKSGIVSYVNPFSYLKLRNNIDLKDFDLITSDGIILKKLSSIFLNKSIQRLSPDFSSYFRPLFKQLSITKSKVYFIGAKPKFIEKSIKNIQAKYPNLNILGFRDGYFKDDEELKFHIKQMITLNPEVIIVGMGSPLQENYLIKLKRAGWTGRGFSCGGFLHQSFQDTDYYPNWINKLNLRWLYRIYKEPKLIKRYTIDYSWFIVVFMYDWMKYTFSKE
tara:strand:- start:630 stop:1361 length:732 start_codon:yes stop_codon:yes gene_type:complete